MQTQGINRLTLLFTGLFTLLGYGGLAYASNDNPEHQFDFLIGEHDVTLHAWAGSTWTPPRPINAIWNGKRGLQDEVIYDEWIDPQNGKGVNVRIFDKAQAVWKMMWVSTSSYQVQDLRAEMRDGVLTMWQVYPVREGWHAQFKLLGRCKWAREDFQVSEDGETVPQFRLAATRRGCEESN